MCFESESQEDQSAGQEAHSVWREAVERSDKQGKSVGGQPRAVREWRLEVKLEYAQDPSAIK